MAADNSPSDQNDRTDVEKVRDDLRSDQPPGDHKWHELLGELRQAAEETQQRWGPIDEFAVARYVAGESDDAEQREIELAIEEYPDLQQCIETVREVLDHAEAPAADPAAPVIAEDEKWSQAVAELASIRDQQVDDWGVIDDVVVARFLAGESSAAERLRVEKAALKHPRLRESIDLVADVLHEASHSDDEGDGETRKQSQGSAVGFGRLVPWGVAAASLLVALGVGAFAVKSIQDLSSQVSRLNGKLAAISDNSAGAGTGEQSSSDNSAPDEFSAFEQDFGDRLAAISAELKSLKDKDDVGSNRQIPTAETLARFESSLERIESIESDVAAIDKTLLRLERERIVGDDMLALASEHMNALEQQASEHMNALEQLINRGTMKAQMNSIAKPVPSVETDKEKPNAPQAADPHQMAELDLRGRRIDVYSQLVETVARYSVSEDSSEDGGPRIAMSPVVTTVPRVGPRSVIDAPPAPVYAELLKAIGDQHSLVRWAALEVLQQRRETLDESQKTQVVNVLSQQNGNGLAAVDYLLNQPLSKPNYKVREALEHGNPMVRWAGIYGLLPLSVRTQQQLGVSGSLAGPAADATPVSKLSSILRNSEEDLLVRKMAVFAIGEYGSKALPALPSLTDIVKTTKDPQMGRWAAFAIGQIGPAATDALPTLLAATRLTGTESVDSDRYRTVFPALAFALGEISQSQGGSDQITQTVELLLQRSKDGDPTIQKWATTALTRINQATGAGNGISVLTTVRPVSPDNGAGSGTATDREKSTPPPPASEPTQPLVPVPQ